eukprot:1314782-Rhodomonas_salina.1
MRLPVLRGHARWPRGDPRSRALASYVTCPSCPWRVPYFPTSRVIAPYLTCHSSVRYVPCSLPVPELLSRALVPCLTCPSSLRACYPMPATHIPYPPTRHLPRP